MRKHRLYGVSLATLALAGGAAFSYATISDAATTANHTTTTIPVASAGSHNDSGGHHYGFPLHLISAQPVNHYVEAAHQQAVFGYLKGVQDAEVGQYLRAVAAAKQQAAQQQAQQAQQQAQQLAQQKAQQAQQAQLAAQQQTQNQQVQLAQQQSSQSSSATSATASSWQQVAVCEEGGRNDPNFGYYGITPSTWQAFGGGQYSATAGGASQSEQLAIAQRIQSTPPDQGGCTGGW